MEEKLKMRTIISRVLLYVGVFVVFFILGRECGKAKEHKENIKITESLNDSLVVWKDKYNKQHAKISVIELDNANQLLDINTKDKEILELQQLVKEYKKKLKNPGSSVVYVKGETIYDTIKEIPKDIAEQIKHLRDGIFDTISNPYIYSSYGFKGSNSYFNLRVYNKYSVVIGQESQGWFKPKKTIVEVVNHNPYSSTSTVRAFQVLQPKETKFSVGPQVGYGFTAQGGQPYIGIGLQYNLIKF